MNRKKAPILGVLLTLPVIMMLLLSSVTPEANTSSSKDSEVARGSLTALHSSLPVPVQRRIGQDPYLLLPNYPWDYADFPLHSYGGKTMLYLTVTASRPLDTYVVNSSQEEDCTTSPHDCTTFVYHSNATDVNNIAVSLPTAGFYNIVLVNDISGTTITFSITYDTIPVDIYQFIEPPPLYLPGIAYPTGPTDYGIQNSSGTIQAYEEEMSQVIGSAVISGISAPKQISFGINEASAGLQLNVMLRVNTTAHTSSQYVYWLQNVLTFDYTSNDTANFVDNIWNNSAISSYINPPDISGSGSVAPSNFLSSGNTTFYSNETASFQYALPLTIQMVIGVSHSQHGVTVSFGYSKASRGVQLPAATFYDNVTITEPQIISDAAIVVDGREMNPAGYFYDTEFIFGGGCCSNSATFKKMNSILSMGYTLTSGAIAVPRSIYGFGSDTGEGSTNLQVREASNGFHVSLGKLGFNQIYPAPPGPSSTSFSCKPKTLKVGSTTTCAATVAGSQPSGNVTWTQTGGKGLVSFSTDTCTLISSSCSVVLTGVSSGSVTIQAVYSGDTSNEGSSATKSLTVK